MIVPGYRKTIRYITDEKEGKLYFYKDVTRLIGVTTDDEEIEDCWNTIEPHILGGGTDSTGEVQVLISRKGVDNLLAWAKNHDRDPGPFTFEEIPCYTQADSLAEALPCLADVPSSFEGCSVEGENVVRMFRENGGLRYFGIDLAHALGFPDVTSAFEACGKDTGSYIEGVMTYADSPDEIKLYLYISEEGKDLLMDWAKNHDRIPDDLTFVELQRITNDAED